MSADVKGGGCVWRSPKETPVMGARQEAFFIVAVRRSHNGKVFSFPAIYANAIQLWYEDEGETRVVTGWFSPESEGDDATSFRDLLSNGDELIAWTDVPQYVEAAKAEGPSS
jgi:hypothetical protein